MFSELAVARQECSSTAEGFAEGAADQRDGGREPVAQPSAPVAQNAQGMGFIHQQCRVMGGAECTDRLQVRTGSLHAEETFRHHHEGGLGLTQALRQVVDVVMAVADQTRPRGADPHQQGVVDQPVGNHRGVSVCQGAESGEVGLKTTRIQQHTVAVQPGADRLLQMAVAWPCARHKPGSSGAEALVPQLLFRCSHNLRVPAEAEVIVAGQIEQGPWLAWVRQQPGLLAAHPRAQVPAAGGRDISHWHSLE